MEDVNPYDPNQVAKIRCRPKKDKWHEAYLRNREETKRLRTEIEQLKADWEKGYSQGVRDGLNQAAEIIDNV